jgi:hypothetical protein
MPDSQGRLAGRDAQSSPAWLGWAPPGSSSWSAR